MTRFFGQLSQLQVIKKYKILMSLTATLISGEKKSFYIKGDNS
jgi:hypothetical protein